MSVNLFISLYPEKDKKRQAELHTCLMNNLKSGIFDAVWIIAEPDENYKIDYLIKYNVKPYMINILPCTVRPTFDTFFACVNRVSDPFDINVISNSDIYFEELPIKPKQNQVFALTRYDVYPNGNVRFLGRKDSQDSWLFQGHIKRPKYSSFHMGVSGCDNRLSRELSIIGYEVLNPSLTIKTYHLHSSPSDHSKSRKIGSPYLLLEPISL